MGKLREKTERFIYNLFHKYKPVEKFISWVKYNYLIYQIGDKLKWLVGKVIDITFTGLLVWYAMPLQNPIQIGLAIALAFHFYAEFITITKRKN